MPNQKNIQAVQTLSDKLKGAKSVLFTDHTGLSVADQTSLRAAVSEAGGEFSVAKNTLIKIALKNELGEVPSDIADKLQGPTSILLSNTDAVSALKALVTFADKNELPEIKIGLMPASPTGGDWKILTAADITVLSKLPGRNELIAQLIGQLNAPVVGFVNVLSGNLRGLVQVLKAVGEKQSN